MRKITNLLSIMLLSSLLSCTGEVISQNVNIGNEIKPTVTPSPTSTITPNVIKPSTTPSVIPSVSSSPKVEEPKLEIPKEKDYSKIVFSLKNKDDENNPYQETISTAPIFTRLKDEKVYYDEITVKNPKNYKMDNIYLNFGEIRKFELDLVYLDGTKDQDYTIQIPEEFKTIIGTQDGKLYGLNGGNSYIKVTSNKNKNIFKFFNISVSFKAVFGCGCDPEDKATFNGKVVDPSGLPVDGVKVSAKVIDSGVTWASEEQLTEGGSFVFRNAPVGARILITVTKDGWTKRERLEVLKSNLTGDPIANKFDFDGIYAIQNEPEITSIKVNGKLATATGPSTKPSTANLENSIANLSGIENKNLEVEMTFSEPVRRDDVQNFFRIVSQNFNIKLSKNFVIDSETSGVTWTWSNDDRTAKFSTNSPILTNVTGQEAKYIIEFTQAYRDKNDNEARAGKYIRFNPANTGDFNVFSVKNDDIKPILESVVAIDGTNSTNDVIELKFSEAMSIIGRKADELELNDPLAPSNKTRSLRAYQTNNTGNNATILGFSTVDNSLNINDFRGIFTISRFTAPFSYNQTSLPLNTNSTIAGNIVNVKDIISAKIIGDKVRLELPPSSFNKTEKILISVGGNLNEVNSNNINFALISDPSGNLLSPINSALGITSSEVQKTTIVQ